MKAVICGELFDGTGLTLKSDWTLLIDGEKIVSSKPTSDLITAHGRYPGVMIMPKKDLFTFNNKTYILIFFI